MENKQAESCNREGGGFGRVVVGTLQTSPAWLQSMPAKSFRVGAGISRALAGVCGGVFFQLLALLTFRRFFPVCTFSAFLFSRSVRFF
jgi:hypothetical protein